MAWFRSPRTTQELRVNTSEEHESFVRPKRKNIPTAYDDILIRNPRHVSWKKTRQTKYKPKTLHPWEK